MKDVLGEFAKAGANLQQWITNLGPYSWNEIAFVLVLTISAILAVITAVTLISRRNRAIEFVDQSEVITSPLRNRMEPRLAAPSDEPETDDSEPVLLTEAVPPTPPAQHLQPVPLAPAAPTKAAATRAQLVLEPLSASSGNIAEIAHASAIAQRLKIVLAALAPHIAVERDAKAFGNLGALDRYVLKGTVRQSDNQLMVQIELTNAKTGATLFNFSFEGQQGEQEVMLAEVTSRILKGTSQPTADRKSDAA